MCKVSTRKRIIKGRREGKVESGRGGERIRYDEMGCVRNLSAET